MSPHIKRLLAVILLVLGAICFEGQVYAASSEDGIDWLTFFRERQIEHVAPETPKSAPLSSHEKQVGTPQQGCAALYGAIMDQIGGAGQLGALLQSGACTTLASRTQAEASTQMTQTLRSGGLSAIVQKGTQAARKTGLPFLSRLEVENGWEGNRPSWEILSVLPFWQDKAQKNHIFGQFSWNRSRVTGTKADDFAGEEIRDAVNAGLAWRRLLANDSLLLGANAFIDHEATYGHSRMSLGGDAQTSLWGASINRYIPLTTWRSINSLYEEKAVAGSDIELRGQMRRLPSWTLFLKGYEWDGSADTQTAHGVQTRVEWTPFGFMRTGIGLNKESHEAIEATALLRLMFQLDRTGALLAPLAARNSLASVKERAFDKVSRTNTIRVQQRLKTAAPAGPPTGYGVAWTTDPVNATNASAATFAISGGAKGDTYSYTISSSGGGTDLMGSGAMSSASATISEDVSSLSDGTLTISLTLTSKGGESGEAVTDTVTKATSIPSGYTVTWGTSAVTASNVTAVSFTILGGATGDAYAYTITSSGGGTAVTGTGVFHSPAHVTADVSGLNDGTLTVTVTVTDPHGNTGSAITSAVAKDATAPTGYSVAWDVSPINMSNEAAAGFTLSGGASGNAYTYTITSSGGGTAVTGNGTFSGTSAAIAQDVSGLTDGTVTVSVTVTDTNGNTGTAITASVTKDATAPTGYSVAWTTDPVNTANTGTAAFTISGGATGDAYDYMITSSGGGTAVTGSGTFHSPAHVVADVSGLNDGTLMVSVTVTDTNGNTGAATTKTVAKDVSVPTGYSLVWATDPVNATNASAASFTISGGTSGDTYSYTISSSGGGASVTGNGSLSGSSAIVSEDISGLSDGTVTVGVTVTDANGNTGATITKTVTKETTAPVGYNVIWTTNPVSMANVSAAGFTISGGISGNSYAYTISSSGGGTALTGNGTFSGTSAVLSRNVSGLGDGTLTVSVTATDTYGNTGAATTATVTKDASAPTGYSVAWSTDPINAANVSAAGFILSGGTNGDTYTYTISSSGGGTTLTGSGTFSGTSASVSKDVSGLGDGTLTVSVTVTDSYTNTGTATTDTVTKDVTAPTGYSVVWTTNPVNAVNASAAGFTISGGTNGNTYNYTISSSGGGTALTGNGTFSGTSASVSKDVSGLNDGTLTISVTSTDTYGNPGIATTATVTKDITTVQCSKTVYASFTKTLPINMTITYTLIGGGGGTGISSSGGGGGGGSSAVVLDSTAKGVAAGGNGGCVSGAATDGSTTTGSFSASAGQVVTVYVGGGGGVGYRWDGGQSGGGGGGGGSGYYGGGGGSGGSCTAGGGGGSATGGTAGAGTAAGIAGSYLAGGNAGTASNGGGGYGGSGVTGGGGGTGWFATGGGGGGFGGGGGGSGSSTTGGSGGSSGANGGLGGCYYGQCSTTAIAKGSLNSGNGIGGVPTLSTGYMGGQAGAGGAAMIGYVAATCDW